jgi:hypothetical protein
LPFELREWTPILSALKGEIPMATLPPFVEHASQLQPSTHSSRTIGWRIRRAFAALAIALYLATLAGFLLQNALGDSGLFPVSYFFTWDMFPSYKTESSRCVAVGRTKSGRYLELYPSPFQQNRGGVHGDLARVDLERRGLFYFAVVEQTLQRSPIDADDPVQQAWLFEQYWPAKFNYPDELYESYWGSRKPDRQSWRLLGEYDVVDERLRDKSASRAVVGMHGQDSHRIRSMRFEIHRE